MDLFGRKIEYTVVLGFGVSDLERKVTDLVKEGWRPVGSPYFSGNDRFAKYGAQQAMIRVRRG